MSADKPETPKNNGTTKNSSAESATGETTNTAATPSTLEIKTGTGNTNAPPVPANPPVIADMSDKLIYFTNGNQARYIKVDSKPCSMNLLSELELRIPAAFIIISGGASGLESLDGTIKARLEQLLNRGLIRAAQRSKSSIVSGGTNSGVMSMLGKALANRRIHLDLVGVCPAGCIDLPKTGSINPDHAELEPNHTHFLLVDSNEWGSETDAFYGLVEEYNKHVPALTVLINGGKISCIEILRSVRMGIPIVVMEGSGRLANDISRLYREQPDFIADPMLAEIIADGQLYIFPVTESPEEFERLIYRQLRGDTTLKLAWRQFGLYDTNAHIHQRRFQRIQMWLLVLGVLGTALVVVQANLEQHWNERNRGFLEQNTEALQKEKAALLKQLERLNMKPVVPANESKTNLPLLNAGVGLSDSSLPANQPQKTGIFSGMKEFFGKIGDKLLMWIDPLINPVWVTLRYIIMFIPILISILLAAANRFNSGTKWLLLRTSAEAVKRDIYRYRTRCEVYSPEQTTTVSREVKLANKLQAVGKQLMQSEVNLSALHAYKGDVPEYIGTGESLYTTDPTDDGLSDLSPQQYITSRLEDQLKYYVRKTGQLEAKLYKLQWLIYLIGGIGTLLAALGLEIWIAVTTSLVTAMGTYIEYQQLQNTLLKYNQAASDLYNVRTWWVALSEEEQKKQSNIDLLVGNTERILQSEFKDWVAEMQEAFENLKEQQAGEEDKDKDGKERKAEEKNRRTAGTSSPKPAPQAERNPEGNAQELDV